MAIIRITTEVSFDYNTETQECIPVSQKVVKKSESKKTSTKTKSAESNVDNPGIIREDGKLLLSDALIEALGAEEGDRILIGYEKYGNGYKPFVKVDEKKGNKLTKSKTVSYRGASNVEFARYGTTFTFEEGKNGTLLLKGDIEIDYTIPKGIKVTEPEGPGDDTGKLLNLDKGFEDDDFGLNLDQTTMNTDYKFNFNDIEL